MGSLSIWHWIIVVLLLLPLIPISHMLGRMGLSRWLTLLFVVPAVAYVSLWVIAYINWPNLNINSKPE
jgi:hypothetical protein